jgi:hypothetical protein
MKSSKIALSIFFALALAVVCLVAAVSVDGLAIGEHRFDNMSAWYAIGGFVLGLISGVGILRYLSPRSLSISSLVLGSMAFIALAILFYFYYENEKKNDAVPTRTTSAVIRSY